MNDSARLAKILSVIRREELNLLGSRIWSNSVFRVYFSLTKCLRFDNGILRLSAYWNRLGSIISYLNGAMGITSGKPGRLRFRFVTVTSRLSGDGSEFPYP